MYHRIEDESGEIVHAHSFDYNSSDPPPRSICLPDECYELVVTCDIWKFNSLVFLDAQGDTPSNCFKAIPYVTIHIVLNSTPKIMAGVVLRWLNLPKRPLP